MILGKMPEDKPPKPLVSTQTGSNVTLIFGGRNYVSVKWTKDGVKFNPGKSGYARFQKESSEKGLELHITDAVTTDSGTYVCELHSLTSQKRQVQLLVEGLYV